MKAIYKFIFVLSFTLLFSSVCYADSIYETESNDTINNAQYIQRNNHNPAQYIQGNNSSQKVVKGTIDRSDNDWFKVYLPADNKTVLSINSKAYPSFEIYDANHNLIMPKLTHIHNYDFSGACPYYVNIPTSGYYYIKVSDNILSGNYIFSIGSPNYSSGNYTYESNNTLTLTSYTDSVQATYDLRNISDIPNGAIVCSLDIGGHKTNRVSRESRCLKLESDYSWIQTSMYSWSAKVPVIMNKQLKSKWNFRLEGKVYSSSRPYSLSPIVHFYYVYPVLPKN